MSPALPIRRQLAPPVSLAGLRAAPLRRVMAGLECGSLEVTTPDGVRVACRAARPGPEACIVLHRWRALRRLAFGGDIAFAEAYGDQYCRDQTGDTRRLVQTAAGSDLAE